MVDDLGNNNQINLSREIAETATRFGVNLTDKEKELQQEKRIKLKAELSLAPFAPKNEAEFEDWVDEAATQVTKLQLSSALFQDVWQSVAQVPVARKIGGIPRDENYESLVNKVARLLFKNKAYIMQFELQLWQSRRCSSVFEARIWVENNVARYYRLCVRWDYPFYLNRERLVEIALNALPEALEDDVRSFLDDPTWDQVWKRAERQEFILINKFGRLPEPLKAFPGQEVVMDTAESNERNKTPFYKREPGPCFCCGQAKHWKKDCPKKNFRCDNCKVIGHLAIMCKNLAIQDAKGRVETRVEPKESSITIKQRKDKSQKDKMVSAEAAIKAVRLIAQKKSEKVGQKRQAAKIASGWQRKRDVVEHPEGVVNEIEDSEEEVVASELDEGFIEQLEGALSVWMAREKEKLIVLIDAVVNGMKCQVAADTCASRSLCNLEAAKLLGLKQIVGTEKNFTGLGDLKGFATEEVMVYFPGKSVLVTFWVVDKPNLPILLGKVDLKKMDIFVDPQDDCLIDRKTLKVVAVGVEAANDKEEVVIDMITQKRKGATDAELLENGRKNIYKKMEHLPINLADKVWNVFSEFKDIWVRPKAAGATGFSAKFVVDGPPIKSKLRYLTPELTEEMNKQLDAMLEAKVIQPSKSPWGAVPVFVKKKDGGWRFCLDYRKLNKQMKSDRYPIPLLWQMVQEAAHHRWYVCLDLNWGYWNLPLDPSSREYTGLLTPRGLFEFVVLPFGIKNSPGEFQRMMDCVLQGLKGVVVYIDDIVIYGDDCDEILVRLVAVFSRLKEKGLFIKLAKTELFKDNVKMLGHIVGLEGILPNPEKVQGIKEARPPKNKSELKSFLGSVSFLRRFIPNCSTLVAPMAQLLKKGVKYEFNEECSKAFRTLKLMMEEQVLLTAPQGNGQIVMVCDASNYGVGAALLQWQEKELMLLEFASKSLSKTEQNWPTYEKEAFAIRWAVGRFEDYIKTGDVLVLTDHKSLEWMESATSGKVRRWALYLQQFNLDIRHISGPNNNIADWLSRSVPEEDVLGDDEKISIPTFVIKEDIDLRKNTSCLVPYVPTTTDIRNSLKDITPEEEKATFQGCDGLRYSIRTEKLFIPKNLREAFIFWMHGSRYGLHCGINRTIRRLKKFVWWPNLAKEVKNYGAGCLVCARMAPPPNKFSLMGLLSRPLPLQMISLDCVGPRIWWNKIFYYVVIIDHASRFIMAKTSLVPPNSAWIIDVIKNYWMPVFQAPTVILTDRGSEFISVEFRSFILRELGCVLVHTSAYYPQGNAINESSHRSLDAAMSACERNLELSFDEALSSSVTIHNSCPHCTTGYTPYYLLYGFEPTLPGWQSIQRRNEENKERLTTLKEVRGREMCRFILDKDENLRLVEYDVQPDDWIVYWLSDYEKKLENEGNIKYSASWSLPAKVKEIKDKTCVVILWGSQLERQVPLAQVRCLQGCVPLSLQEINLKELNYFVPRKYRPKPIIVGGDAMGWNEFLSKAGNQQAVKQEEVTIRKRARQV